LKAALRSPRFWIALCLAWGAIIALSHSREMDPDGFSYLQMAGRCADGDCSALINSYWSPGYPAMMSLLLALFRPAPESAFAFAHLLNYLLFIAAIASFVYFLRGWSDVIQKETWLVLPLCFVLFLKFSVDWLGLHNCTPDLAVGTVVLLAAGIVSRISRQQSPPWLLLPLLGFVLGIGYYIKVVVFPFSVFLFVLLLLIPPGPRVSRGMVLLAVAAFGLIAAPLIALQSRSAGHFSIGESGPMNYAWYVNGVMGVHRGRVAEGQPVHFIHPPRHLTDHPITLEFATPVHAIYPIWYDPYYWSQGIHAAFNLKQQIATLRVTLMIYAGLFMEIAALIAAAIVLLATGSGRLWPLGWASALVVAWPICALGLYSLVHTETRFLGGFMIVFWTGLLSAALQRSRIASKGAVVALILATLMIPATFRLVLAGGRLLSRALHPEPTIDVTAARALTNLGLHKGDRIAVVGETFEPYYAWIAGVNVVAQVPDQDELWRFSKSDFQDWLAIVARSGAKALVTMDRPSYANQVSWLDLPLSSERSSTIAPGPHQYSVFLLPPANSPW
jgi:hypothetical protein